MSTINHEDDSGINVSTLGHTLGETQAPEDMMDVDQSSPIPAVERPITTDLQEDMFEIGERLGNGRFSRIHFAKNRENGFPCAIKTHEKRKLTGHTRQERERIRQQIQTQSRLSHPNIVQVYGHFENEKQICIVREYVSSGDLYELLKEKGRFPESEAAGVIAQTRDVLQYLHDKKFIHRDIKPEHILIGADGKIKVSGFYWTIHAPEGRSSELCGTLDYLAPEMLRLGASTGAFYDEKVDLWCLGVLIYELLVGEAPFSDTLVMTQRKIQRGEMQIPSHVSAEAEDLIRNLLVVDPEMRLSLGQIQQHPWITKHTQAEEQHVGGTE